MVAPSKVCNGTLLRIAKRCRLLLSLLLFRRIYSGRQNRPLGTFLMHQRKSHGSKAYTETLEFHFSLFTMPPVDPAGGPALTSQTYFVQWHIVG